MTFDLESTFVRHVTCALCLAFGLVLGCSNEASRPKPIAVEQAPASLQEAFKAAKPEAKKLADEVVAAMASKDYTTALFALQSLAGRSDLTAQQREIASSSMLSVNQALAEQANSGDQKAQQALDARRATK